MYYEEHCQLGFASPAKDFFNGFDHHYSDQENESHNYQQTEEMPAQNLISNAALKLNFEKKVKFGEQLQFKIDQPVMFQSEEPRPIEFKNNSKSGIKATNGQQKKKSKKTKKLLLHGQVRPKSAKQKAQPKYLGDWNQDTRAQKYFDVNIDLKAKREFEKEERLKKLSQKRAGAQTEVGAPVVDKHFEEGKVEVGYKRPNGQVGSKFQMYHNIDTLNDDTHKINYAATGYSLKRHPVTSQEQKRLVPAYSASGSPQKHGKVMIAEEQSEQEERFMMLKGQRSVANVEQVKTEMDIKLHQLVGETFQQKEVMIKALEDELEQERKRREHISQQFKNQITDFEKEKEQLDKLRQATKSMKQNTQDTQPDLDMVPSKQEKSTHRSHLSKKAPSTYRSERVKTSIPKPAQPKEDMKKTTKYMEELKRQELERAIKLQEDERIAAEVVKKLKDCPNEGLNRMQEELKGLGSKVEPLLRRVEEAARNINLAREPAKGPIGMLQKMGGRLINFYSEELTEKLLDDFLIETALTLQELEKTQLKDYSNEEAKETAQYLLKTLVDYQSEEHLLQRKWLQSKKPQKVLPFNDLFHEDPQPITYGDSNFAVLNPDLSSVLDKPKTSGYQNPFSKIDPFSQKLAELSMSAPDKSYNLMPRLKEAETEPQIQIQKIEEKRRWKVNISKEQEHNIVVYRENYEKYLKMHNNTASKEVWQIYDHIAADLFNEIYKQALQNVSKDMEEYIEKVIYDEFQLN